MEMRTTMRTLLKLGITVVILLLLWKFTKDWIKPRVVKALGGYTEKEVKTKVDTLTVKYKDIYVKYKELQTKVTVIPEPIYIDNYVYVKETKTNSLNTTGSSQPKITVSERVKRYSTSINDSILDGNIETILSLENCEIISQSLNYKPKIPYIREKIITIVNNTETILSDKPKAYIGAGINASSNNQITPQVLYLTKKKWLYNIGYQKDITNQLPNSIQIGISKLF